MYFVYLLECGDKSLYCGYTKDLEKRIEQHNAGKAAKYTRSRRPVKLVYWEKKPSLRAALKREHEIKSLSRSKKEKLILENKALR